MRTEVTEQRPPNLFIVGSAKCGTTAYANFLNRHAEFYLPEIKEPSPFADGYRYKMALDNYLGMYSRQDRTKVQYLIDASTPHLTTPTAASKIYNLNPHAKILIFLRNPVKRAFSLFHWMRFNGYEWLDDFKSALAIEKSMRTKSFKNHNPQYYWNYLYFKSGIYCDQIKRYMNVFPPENIMIRPIDHSRYPANIIVDDLSQFLGVPLNAPKLRKENQAEYAWSGRLQFAARHNFQDWKNSVHRPLPGLGKLARFLNNSNRSPFAPRISRELYSVLQHEYLPSIVELEHLLNLSLNDWKV